MNKRYNVYCDESCHLENDGINDMVLGAVWCPQDKVKEINQAIKYIKERYGVRPESELKWTKVSPVKAEMYKELVEYFFDCEYLHFRCLVVPDKSKLNHVGFKQTHDDWYYKMYFDMIKAIFNPKASYQVYIDIKDTNSYKKAQKLKEVSSNSIYDFSGQIVQRVQPIRSHEVQIMQIVDVLIGAVAYQNRYFPADFKKSPVKLELIQMIKEKTKYQLTRTTLFKEDKFNIFVWESK